MQKGLLPHTPTPQNLYSRFSLLQEFFVSEATGTTRRAGKGTERACPLRRNFRPCGHEGFSLNLVWAACAAGGRWGPVRGCAPPRPPLHSPRNTPLAFLISPLSRPFPTGLSNFHIPRGLRVLCCGSFLASLGDLPARRAIPPTNFALIGCCTDRRSSNYSRQYHPHFRFT